MAALIARSGLKALNIRQTRQQRVRACPPHTSPGTAAAAAAAAAVQQCLAFVLQQICINITLTLPYGRLGPDAYLAVNPTPLAPHAPRRWPLSPALPWSSTALTAPSSWTRPPKFFRQLILLQAPSPRTTPLSTSLASSPVTTAGIPPVCLLTRKFLADAFLNWEIKDLSFHDHPFGGSAECADPGHERHAH
eukprot:1155861-Pelagomonas_calceolata.AAC.2